MRRQLAYWFKQQLPCPVVGMVGDIHRLYVTTLRSAARLPQGDLDFCLSHLAGYCFFGDFLKLEFGCGLWQKLRKPCTGELEPDYDLLWFKTVFGDRMPIFGTLAKLNCRTTRNRCILGYCT